MALINVWQMLISKGLLPNHKWRDCPKQFSLLYQLYILDLRRSIPPRVFVSETSTQKWFLNWLICIQRTITQGRAKKSFHGHYSFHPWKGSNFNNQPIRSFVIMYILADYAIIRSYIKMNKLRNIYIYRVRQLFYLWYKPCEPLIFIVTMYHIELRPESYKVFVCMLDKKASLLKKTNWSLPFFRVASLDITRNFHKAV